MPLFQDEEVEALKSQLARAREEQREACAQSIRPKEGEMRLDVLTRIAFSQGVVRATPLDATPLADEILELRELLSNERNRAEELRPHDDGCNWRSRGDAYPCSCAGALGRAKKYDVAEIERLSEENETLRTGNLGLAVRLDAALARMKELEAFAQQAHDGAVADSQARNVAEARVKELEAEVKREKAAHDHECEDRDRAWSVELVKVRAALDAANADRARLREEMRAVRALVESLREGVEDLHWYSAHGAMNEAQRRIDAALAESEKL